MTQPIAYVYCIADTSLEFSPTNPAKLSGYGPLSVVLDATGADGLVYLLAQHYNDRIGSWSSLADIPGAWSALGSLAASGSIALPDVEIGPGEKLLFGLGFQSTDGTKPAPAFVCLSLPWLSDVTAPDAPTISKITAVAPPGGQVGYRADFSALPTGARHLIVEGSLNGGAYLPFSKKAKFEAGTSYLEFRGHVDQIEAAGERNETHFSNTGVTLGDIVRIKVAAEDAVGNRSAFAASDALTIAGATYVPVLIDSFECEVMDIDEIEVEIL